MKPRLLILGILALAIIAPALPVNAANAPVHVLKLDSSIEPTMAQYIVSGIKRAENERAAAVVIQMDTPGGLLTSTTDIVRAMLESRVPVIVYVYPRTARAASAGTFITLAANVAVMAPDTRIGSAHPVSTLSLGDPQKSQQGGDESEKDVMTEKIVNDSVSFIRSIAKERGRNADWAEAAVRRSANITAEEAVKKNVVDFIAVDMRDMLNKADGRTVKTAAGNVTLAVKNAPIVEFDMPWYKELLHYVANPDVAFILLLLAIYGIIFEIHTPGATYPGVIGVVSLVLFLYSVSILPVNFSGLILVVAGVGMMLADIKVMSHGVLSIGGIVAFFFGALILFGSGSPAFRISIALLIAGTLVTAAFIIFLVGLGVRALRRPVVTGREGVVGRVLLAKTDIAPTGKVFTEGAWWTAETTGEPINKGDIIRIVGMDGLKMIVVKENNESKEELK
ncbi:MAG: nodulation protein NfeD [Armatimonadota bacterium]